MKIDCVLLYGNSTLPASKYAGTFRIATELRKHGYTVQTVDLMTLSKRQVRKKYDVPSILNSRKYDYRQQLLTGF
jgi:hypothetical protein